MKVFGLLLVAFGQYAIAANWSYEGEHGPEAWGHLDIANNQCGRNGQSPIDIDVLKAVHDRSLKPLTTRNYEDSRSDIYIENNGHSVQLNSPNWTQRLSGGPLKGDYRLLQMHFHWGKDSYRGSEHTVNGKRYPIELHLVHLQNNLSDASKATFPGGLAVLGVFFDITKGESAPGIKRIAEVIQNMKANAESVRMRGSFSPSMVVPGNLDFFTYDGSLTTPPCSEVVTWLVLREPLKINERDLEAFRSTFFPDDRKMVDNFRPTLPVNNRQVRSSFAASSSNSMINNATPGLVLLLLQFVFGLTRFLGIQRFSY